MVRASHWSSEGCGCDPRLGLRNCFSEYGAWRSFIYLQISICQRGSLSVWLGYFSGSEILHLTRQMSLNKGPPTAKWAWGSVLYVYECCATKHCLPDGRFFQQQFFRISAFGVWKSWKDGVVLLRVHSPYLVERHWRGPSVMAISLVVVPLAHPRVLRVHDQASVDWCLSCWFMHCAAICHHTAWKL